MHEERMPSDGGISTADIKILNYFSAHLPRIIADCQWYVGTVYFQKRRRFVSILAKYWGQTEESVSQHVGKYIEGDATKNLRAFFSGPLIVSEDGRRLSLTPPKEGASLKETFELACKYASSIIEASAGLDKMYRYYTNKQKEIENASWQERGLRYNNPMILVELNNVMSDFNDIFPKFEKDVKRILKVMRKFGSKFRDGFNNKMQKIFLSSQGGKFKFEIASELLTDNCRVSMPISMTDNEKILRNIDFDSITLRQKIGKDGCSLTIKQCRGKLDLVGMKPGSKIIIVDSPQLILITSNCQIGQVKVIGYLKSFFARSSSISKIHIAGNVGNVGLVRSKVSELHASAASVSMLKLIGSRACVFAYNGSMISNIFLDESSESSLFLKQSQIGFVESASNLHLITEGSKVEKISLLKTKVAFVYSLMPGLESTVVEKSEHSGIYQITEDQRTGAQFLFFSRLGVQGNTPQRVSFHPVDSETPTKREYFSRIVGQGLESLDFYRLDPLMPSQSMPIVVIRSASLLLSRSNINPEETAWLPIFSELRPMLTSLNPTTAPRLMIERYCSDFMLWRAESLPEQHQLAIDGLSDGARVFALQHIEEQVQFNQQKEERRIKEEIARFNLDMAGLSVLTEACFMIGEYEPGQIWRSQEKYRVKIDLHEKIQTILVDPNLKSGDMGRRMKEIIEDSRVEFPSAWSHGKSLSTYLNLAKEIIERYLNISLLARQVDNVVKQELGKEGAPEFFHTILKNHKKRAATNLLPDAALATIEEIKSAKANLKNKVHVAYFEDMLSRPSFKKLEIESSEAKKIEYTLSQVARLASAYTPVIALFGRGKAKLTTMQFLSDLAGDSTKTTKNKRAILAACLRQLRHEELERSNNTRFNPILTGFRLWELRSRENRGYKDTLNRISTLFFNAIDRERPTSWPVLRQPEEVISCGIPGIQQAVREKQASLFSETRSTTKTIKGNKLPNETRVFFGVK